MSKNMQSRTPLSPNRASASLHRPPILSRLKTTARKLSELDVTSLPGIDSRVALSQSRARVVPLLLALTALPSFLALKTTARKLSELDVTSLPGIDSRVALSQSRARIVPLLALTALPSSLALKIAAQKVSGARRYVAPRG